MLRFSVVTHTCHTNLFSEITLTKRYDPYNHVVLYTSIFALGAHCANARPALLRAGKWQPLAQLPNVRCIGHRLSTAIIVIPKEALSRNRVASHVTGPLANWPLLVACVDNRHGTEWRLPTHPYIILGSEQAQLSGESESSPFWPATTSATPSCGAWVGAV